MADTTNAPDPGERHSSCFPPTLRREAVHLNSSALQPTSSSLSAAAAAAAAAMVAAAAPSASPPRAAAPRSRAVLAAVLDLSSFRSSCSAATRFSRATRRRASRELRRSSAASASPAPPSLSHGRLKDSKKETQEKKSSRDVTEEFSLSKR
jgi:hypothetical protein